MSGFLMLAPAKRLFQPPPSQSAIVVSIPSDTYQVTTGDVAVRDTIVSITAGPGLPALQNLQIGTPTQGWLTITSLGSDLYRVRVTPTGVSHALQTATITLTAANASPATITRELTETAAPVPVISLSQTSGLDFTGQEGQSTVTPGTRAIAVTNSGTGTLSGLGVSLSIPGLSGAITAALDVSTAPAVLTLTAVGGVIAAAVDGVYPFTGQVTGSGASAVGFSGALTINNTVGAFYAAPTTTLPTGRPWDSSLGKPVETTVTCAIRHYGQNNAGVSQDNRPASWVDMTTVADSLGRTLGSDRLINASVYQRWLNDDASGAATPGTGTAAGAPRRRGYEAGTTTVFGGNIVYPHNPATNSWTGFRTKGTTFNGAQEVPPSQAAAYATFTSIAQDTPAVSTSTSGVADSHHGRVLMHSFHVRADATLTGGQFGAFHAGLIRLGSSLSIQDDVTKVPAGFCLIDFTIVGQRRRYYRKALELHADDVEVRAFDFDEIHNSFDYAAGSGGLSQDSQGIVGWNASGRWDITFGKINGCDEGINLGGGGSQIANLPNLRHVFIGWVECAKTDDFLFNTANTVTQNGPFDRTTANASGAYAFWQGKNHFEVKIGSYVFFFGCRGSGIRAPNNNQGYGVTLKSNTYGQLTPTQRAEHITWLDGWIDRSPGMFGTITYQADLAINGGGPGLPLQYVHIEDTFGWALNAAPYNQANKRRFLAMTKASNNQPLVGFVCRHNSCLTTESDTGGAIFIDYAAGAPSIPGAILEDNLMPYVGVAFWCSDGSTTVAKGTQAMDLVCGAGNYSMQRNTLVPKSGGVPATSGESYPTGWTAETSMANAGVADYAAGNLRLTSGSYRAGQANQAPDGWNRGVRDPSKTYVQLKRTPTNYPTHPTVV